STCVRLALISHVHLYQQTRLTAVSFLLHAQLTGTHTCYIYMEATRTHYTHTHAHAGLRSPCIFALPLNHPGASLLQDPPGAVGSFSAPGDQVNRPSRSGTDRIVLFFWHVFLLGFLAEETPCEHGESIHTPHTHTHTHTHKHTNSMRLQLLGSYHLR